MGMEASRRGDVPVETLRNGGHTYGEDLGVGRELEGDLRETDSGRSGGCSLTQDMIGKDALR